VKHLFILYRILNMQQWREFQSSIASKDLDNYAIPYASTNL